MATEKWVAGATAGWVAANTSASQFDSIVNGNARISDLVIDNSTNLDMFADISWQAGGTATTAAPNYLGFYLLPALADGTTLGDGRWSTSTAGPPPSCYAVGTIQFAAAASTTINGEVRGIILPAGKFSFLVYNQSGATLATSNIFKYRTYNRSVA